ncbi:MAG: beta-ketoacyl synthase [Gemmatimonadetes bacterium]|nr:beta-ketoacyl synthase [Gemmatimonadota bacterium]
MSPVPASRWFTCPRPRPGAVLRLLCIPHAGAGAGVFRGWGDALPAEVEVCGVQPPGREARLGEPAFDRMAPLVDALAAEVAAADDLPFAVFGHSNGALIGFELARRLRAGGEHGPLHLFASGRRAPDLPNPLSDVHHLPDDAFLEDLVALGGTPREVAEHPELMRMLLPLLRADVALNEAYAFAEAPPLECGITAYGGLADPKATRPETEAWRRHTAGPFTARFFAGDHFFPFGPARDLVLRTLAADLHDLLSRAARGLPL